MDGANIKQIGIASVLRSLFKGSNKHYIYKDLCSIVHSPDRKPDFLNPYSDFSLSYRQDIDDKLYNYNKLLNENERINDIWFDQRTIDNYNKTRYNPVSYNIKTYVSPYRFTITPSNIHTWSPSKKRLSSSPSKYKRSSSPSKKRLSSSPSKYKRSRSPSKYKKRKR